MGMESSCRSSPSVIVPPEAEQPGQLRHQIRHPCGKAVSPNSFGRGPRHGVSDIYEVPSDIEERVTDIIRGIVAATLLEKELSSPALYQGSLVAVVLKILEGHRGLEPRGQQTNTFALGSRSQYAIREDDLRPATRRTVAAGLLFQSVIGDESTAPQTRPSRG